MKISFVVPRFLVLLFVKVDLIASIIPFINLNKNRAKTRTNNYARNTTTCKTPPLPNSSNRTDDDSSSLWYIWIIVAFVLLMIANIIVILVCKRRKEKKRINRFKVIFEEPIEMEDKKTTTYNNTNWKESKNDWKIPVKEDWNTDKKKQSKYLGSEKNGENNNEWDTPQVVDMTVTDDTV